MEQKAAARFDLEAIREEAIHNICDVFSCAEGDVTEWQRFPAGLSNILMTFQCNGKKYIYRHPGPVGSVLANRGREAVMQEVAAHLGCDNTFVAMDVEKGWMIRRFFDGYPFDYHNPEHVSRAMALLQKLHSAPAQVRWASDPRVRAEMIKTQCDSEKFREIPGWDEIDKHVRRLLELVENDGVPLCYIHRDAREENFLINDDNIYLIDWESSCYGDPAYDVGTYICLRAYTEEEVDAILRTYFGHEPSRPQKRHFYAHIAIVGWWYLHWAAFSETLGQRVDSYKRQSLYYVKTYSENALKMYMSADPLKDEG